MKHLKKLFESSEKEYIKHYGITPDELIYFFTDISDEGWEVTVRFMKKMYNSTQTQPMNDSDVKFGLIPYIQTEISKKEIANYRTETNIAEKDLNGLLNSELLLETIDVVSKRLSDIGLFIKKYSIENRVLVILIYRKSDENYIK